MTTPSRTSRLVAALACVATTLALFSAVVGQARPPVADALLAQAGSTHTA